MKQNIVIGKIIGAHGVHGEIKVFPITDDARRFFDLSEVFLLFEDERSDRSFVVRNVRLAGKFVILSFEGIDDRDKAHSLSGEYISVDREQAVLLSEGSYFIADLIGCDVWDDEKGLLGSIRDVLQSSGADVFAVARKNKKDLLIPFVKSVVYDVDISKRQIHLRLPAGLFEVYED